MARYMDSAERAEENRSSAWILLILGGVGLIVIILGFFNIIPFPFKCTNVFAVPKSIPKSCLKNI